MLKYYIKERINPQNGTYYVPRGRMHKKEARRIEDKCMYGWMFMHPYDTKEAYDKAIEDLKLKGERVHPEYQK